MFWARLNPKGHNGQNNRQSNWLGNGCCGDENTIKQLSVSILVCAAMYDSLYFVIIRRFSCSLGVRLKIHACVTDTPRPISIRVRYQDAVVPWNRFGRISTEQKAAAAKGEPHKSN
jgi:hypothetical protein